MNQPESNFWGRLITAIREEKGVSQRELSAVAAVSRNNLRNIEKGKVPPGVDVLERILTHFGYEIDVFEKCPPHRKVSETHSHVLD